jgi:predicted glycoside hydrolase/deacetylase ChbG (UPF0249 family)
MLIVTADDLGKDRRSTDRILRCFARKSITSTSAMVFMDESERAAALARESGIETGLHLNLTAPFNLDAVPPRIRDRHERVMSYLGKNRLAQILYNPFLANSFKLLFEAQLDEYIRLYERAPAFYNGHHHMHLCANMLIGKIIPSGTKIRRTFTFGRADKGAFNFMYRRILDGLVSVRYASTDSFYSILPLDDMDRLRGIIGRSAIEDVELEVHPENDEEIEFLLSDVYRDLIGSAPMGDYSKIPGGRS